MDSLRHEPRPISSHVPPPVPSRTGRRHINEGKPVPRPGSLGSEGGNAPTSASLKSKKINKNEGRPGIPSPVPLKAKRSHINNEKAETLKLLNSYLHDLQSVGTGESKLMLEEIEGKKQISHRGTKPNFFGRRGTSKGTKAAYAQILETATNALLNSKDPDVIVKASEVISELSNNKNAYVKNILKHSSEFRKKTESLPGRQQLKLVEELMQKNRIPDASRKYKAIITDKKMANLIHKDKEAREILIKVGNDLARKRLDEFKHIKKEDYLLQTFEFHKLIEDPGFVYGVFTNAELATEFRELLEKIR